MYVLYDDTRSFMHEMDDDRIMSRTCLSQATVGDHNTSSKATEWGAVAGVASHLLQEANERAEQAAHQ